MLSLGGTKDGVALPSEEDRKRIITQMKVRTTLKSDKSWIQQKSNTEEEKNHSPLHSPRRSNAGRSPVSPRALSPNRRVAFAEPSSQGETMVKNSSKKSPGATSPSGYIIRGVFTKTVDKTPPSNTASNGSPNSPKTASLPRTSQGYKMTTEDYKRLAPYNIKRELSDPGDEEPAVSLDEQKKRTEAASSVLRRTASKERSYVLSAAKKSNRSATQESPPFVATRIDLEDDISPRSRSQTVPASVWFNSRGNNEKNERKTQTTVKAEKQGAIIAEESLESRKSKSATMSEKSQVPPVMICPEASPKRSSLGLEQEKIQKMPYECPSDTEYKKVEAHLAKSGSWSSESSFSTTATQSEFPGYAKTYTPELDTTRSSTVSNESGITTPESQQGEDESDSDMGRSYYPFRDSQVTGSPRSHRMPFYRDLCDIELGRNFTGSNERIAATSAHLKNSSASGYDSDPTTSSKGILFVKESVTELSSSPRFNSRSLADLSELEKSSSSRANFLNSALPKRPPEDMCTYCGREIRNCAKITIENLKICCHEYCFRCGICHKPMGDLLDKIFIHRDIVHCDKCYEKLF